MSQPLNEFRLDRTELLAVSDVRKVFIIKSSKHVALDGVSIHVSAGERVALVGSSGSGKSTLANVILGLERADAGNVKYDGVDLQAGLKHSKRDATVRRKLLEMQMVFQSPAASFLPRMKVSEGIMEGLAYREGFDRRKAEGLVLEMMERVQLPASYANKKVCELSGGECQRAAIARALVSHPRLLVCDEPTSSLDVTVQAKIMALLDELCAETNAACLFVSHDLTLVSGFCQRAYVMDAGKVVEEGVPADIFEHPASEMGKCLASAIIEL